MIEALAFRYAGALDHLRALLLRLTLRPRWLRSVYPMRARRLLLLHLLATTSSLALALTLPLWVLLLGPLVYGVPHLLSSVRYFHHTLAEAPGSAVERSQGRAFFGLAFLVLSLVFGYRLLATFDPLGIASPQLSEWAGSSRLELIALGLTFTLAIRLYRPAPRRVARGIAVLAPFTALFIAFPGRMIGTMVLLHNFVAFAYWIQACRTQPERTTARIALLLTLALTAAILAGLFDPVLARSSPALALSVAELSIADTGRLILPGHDAGTLWLRACVAFSFGQSLHYFVWLKAIPDQHHRSQVPSSFRQSLSLLQEDFGRGVALVLVLLGAGSLVIWSFMTFQQARLIYFCLASFHGYLEIAGLCLARFNARTTLGIMQSDESICRSLRKA